MFKKTIFKACFGAVAVSWSAGAMTPASAQVMTQPVFHTFSYSDESTISGMSDNGLWAVACAISSDDETLQTYPKLINLTTNTTTPLLTVEECAAVVGCGVADVTDDGRIAVGNYNGMPAYWNNGVWETVELPAGYVGGRFSAITPDGQYAVATCGTAVSIYEEHPVLYRLTDDGAEIVETPGLPTLDMTGLNQNQSRFISLSPDAKYILGCLSYSYIQPAAICYYVYNRETQAVTYIGFDKSEAGVWTPKDEYFYFIDDACMSPDGRWVSGFAHHIKPVEGSSFPIESKVAFKQNIETGEFESYTTNADLEMAGFAIDANGVIYAATPATSPAREAYVRTGNYWYGFRQLLKQGYGVDYLSATNFDNTGTPIAVNVTGTKIAVLASARSYSYVIDLPESFTATSASIDLLADYTVSPESGSTLSAFSSATVTFDRDVQIIADKADVLLQKADGTTVRSAMAFALVTGSTMAVKVTFRSTALTAGETYRIVIPAGAIALAGDATRTNHEITLSYVGRANKPVEMLSAYPTDGTAVAQLDYSTHPAVFYFDTKLALTDTASAQLYREGDEDAICQLSLYAGDTLLLAYPTTTQYLYKDSRYIIKVAAGSVTEINGFNGNEAFEITYKGAYEQEIIYNDTLLYSEDFNTNILSKMMLYEGDSLVPNSAMQEFGCTTTTTPWNYAADDDAQDNPCAFSHSMYSPAGKSDDWMVLPRVFVTNAQCYLTWNSQSYLKNKTDVLKVVAWVSDGAYNNMTAATIDKFKSEGVVIYEGVETPGATEGKLAGEWTSHTVSLAQFEGKNIYVAFVNQNEDQSCIFVDDINILVNQNYLVALTAPASLVAKSEAEIGGVLSVLSKVKTYTEVNLTCYDAAGAVVGTLHRSGAWAEGDTCRFTFAEKLPLTAGRACDYTVAVDMNGDLLSVNGTVKNLAFQPTKRVLLEEGTGGWCQNCPQGILAVEKLEQTYGDRFIPISIHYNDLYDFSDYVSLLGLVAYPTGVVDRSGVITSPMASTSAGTYTFTLGDGSLWMDAVQNAFEKTADADLKVSFNYDAATGRYTAPTTFTFAMDASDLNVNLLYVVLEDSLTGTYQSNNLYNSTDPIFGRFGSGGSYGSPVLLNYPFYDVARALVGTTTSGFGGYVPSTVVAGEEYSASPSFAVPSKVADVNRTKVVCLMLNANTGALINVARSSMVNTTTGIAAIESKESEIAIRPTDDAVSVVTAGRAVVALYGADGSLIGSRAGSDHISVSTRGYQGMVMVRVWSEGRSICRKVVVK